MKAEKNISRENVKIALFVLFEPQHAANKEKNFAAKKLFNLCRSAFGKFIDFENLSTRVEVDEKSTNLTEQLLSWEAMV